MKLAVWRVEWSNPYTSPPDGRPRVPAEMVVPWEDGGDKSVPPALAEIAAGRGWSLTWQFLSPPARRVPQEVKAVRRQKAVAKRMEARYPLFAGVFTEEKIAAKPAYYLDGKSDYDEEAAALLAAEAAYYEEALGRVGVLVRFEEEA